MGIVKLSQESIPNCWVDIEDAVNKSLPLLSGNVTDRNNRILEQLLLGRMHCWVYAGEDKSPVYLCITSVLYDPGSDTNSLLLYCLYGYRVVSVKEIADGIDVAKLMAKKFGCSRVIAYSDNEFIIKTLERLGADSSYRLLSIPI